MAIEISPAELNVDPVFVRGSSVVGILRVMEQGRLGNVPLVGSEEHDVRARGVHLVRLPGVNRLLLDVLDLQSVELLIEDLAQIHRDTLVDLLPKMGPEDLDEGDFESGDLTVHEDTGEVKLDLETDVDVGTVDGRRPPERETTVGDLSKTRTLRVRELLVLHALLKARRLLPEETLPSDEVRALEQGVLEDALNSTEGLNHISPVIVKVPELSIVPRVGPPEWVG
mmetsp:Transcript_17531/g.36310  ORF Transcript_17531/g.36310 Transcript_17531/m.36310 type:complete len:226 (+) Transcript_17531:2049-2726(+)